jgi:hypothetical protein
MKVRAWLALSFWLLTVALLAVILALVSRNRVDEPRDAIGLLAFFAFGTVGALIYVTTLLLALMGANMVAWAGGQTTPMTAITGMLIGIALTGFPVAVGLSILRYRLWDIDLLMRRTLIYSSLTAALLVVYFSSVVVLQALVGTLTGESQSPLVTVLSTLAIAALFVPLRRRVQDIIDRRFFRQKYGAARTLATFGAQARDVVEMEQLTGQLLRVVDVTLQPAHVSLRVRKAGRQ